MTHLLIIASYALIAGVVGVVLPRSAYGMAYEISQITAYIIAGSVFLSAALMHEMMARRRATQALGDTMREVWHSYADEVEILREANRQLVDDLEVARQEVGTLRGTVENDRGRASEAVVAEMRVLQAQLTQLAEVGRPGKGRARIRYDADGAALGLVGNR